MSEPCPTGCGRPCSLGRDMCLLCWRRVPIDLQSKMYRLAQLIHAEPNNEKHQRAYALVFERAIKAVPV